MRHLLVAVALLLLSSATLNLVTASNTTAASSPTSAPSAPSANIFSVRSLPFNDGNDAKTFQDQLQTITRQLPKLIANKSEIVLAYNQSSQMQQCWAEIQECTQTLTWWFSKKAGNDANENLFLSWLGSSPDDATTAKQLGMEEFRKGPAVPERVLEEPSIMPFLTTIVGIYGSCSVLSILAMFIAYKIANGRDS